MADANGTSPPPLTQQQASDGAAVGGGEFMAVAGAGPNGHGSYQALLASMGGQAPPSASANVLAQHQYQQYHQLSGAAGDLIHATPPPPMPIPIPAPSPPPPPPNCAQSNLLLPAGRYHYQNWQPQAPQNGIAAAQQVPITAGDFGEWTVYNSAYVSVAYGGSSSSSTGGRGNNGYHQRSRYMPYGTNFMQRNPYSVYPHAIQNRQAPSYYHGYNQEQGSGFVSSFRVDPPLVPAPCFQPILPVSKNHSGAQFFDEPTYTKRAKRGAMYTRKKKNSEDPPEMGSENSDELDHALLYENQNWNQGQESFTSRFNCKEYIMAVCKELTNSDVGNIGRVIVPKRDAEDNLPALLEGDGVILKMEDFILPVTWNIKFRFWPNNKGRMYVFESTGDFAKHHNLVAGDTLIIYKSQETGKFLVRGVKMAQQHAPFLCLGCKEEGTINKECGFAKNLDARKRR